MSSVKLNVQLSVWQQLSDINLMAQSTKRTIAGRIGVLNDAAGKPRVVKFNTHWTERLFGASKSQEMIDASNNLRDRLCALIDGALAGEDRELEDARAALKAKIGDAKSTSLLDRSVVADVIKQVEKIGKEKSLCPEGFTTNHTKDELNVYSSRDENTSFEEVRTEAQDLHFEVVDFEEEFKKTLRAYCREDNEDDTEPVEGQGRDTVEPQNVPDAGKRRGVVHVDVSQFRIESPHDYKHAMDEEDLESVFEEDGIEPAEDMAQFVENVRERYPNALIVEQVLGGNRFCGVSDPPGYFNAEENAKYVCENWGKRVYEADGKTFTNDFKLAKKFLETFYERKQKDPSLLSASSNMFTEPKYNTRFTEAMYLLLNCGEAANVVFNPFCAPAHLERNIDDLISYVQNGKLVVPNRVSGGGRKVTVPDDYLRIDAETNYDQFLVRTFCRLFSAARQSGADVVVCGISEMGDGKTGRLLSNRLQPIAFEYAAHSKNSSGKVMKFFFTGAVEKNGREEFKNDVEEAVGLIDEEKARRAKNAVGKDDEYGYVEGSDWGKEDARKEGLGEFEKSKNRLIEEKKKNRLIEKKRAREAMMDAHDEKFAELIKWKAAKLAECGDDPEEVAKIEKEYEERLSVLDKSYDAEVADDFDAEDLDFAVE